MSAFNLELSQAEADALARAAFVGLKGSRPIRCATETRNSLSGKLAALLAAVLENRADKSRPVEAASA